jgi:cytochrome c-type biogenesis protein CcmH
MGFAALLLFVALASLLIWRVAKPSGQDWQMIGAALLLAVAGYAWQGSPGLAAHSVKAKNDVKAAVSDDAEGKALMERFGSEGEYLNFADALTGIGRTDAAVAMIKGGLKKMPNSPELWVGLGNALVAHGEGLVSPSAAFAYDKARQVSPKHPGADYFEGLALAKAGQVEQARAMWEGLMARTPQDAPWKADLAQKLKTADQLLAGQLQVN